MRYHSNHAASSDSVPFMLRGPKSLKRALSAAVATAIGLTPALMFASPASAVSPDPTLAISNPANTTGAAVTEGNSVTFTVTPSATGTYTFSIGASSTASASDYTALTSGQTSLSLVSGTPQTITVQTTDDSLYEGATPETLVLRGTNSNGTDYTESTAYINDNDSPPAYTLTAAPNPVTEAVGATATITATLSAASGVATSIALSTANGTAVSGTAPNGDYTALSGAVINIPAGQTTGTQTVAITNDGIKDTASPETFTVNGVGTNVAVANQSVQVGIVDAQTTPTVTLSAGSTQAAEGSPFTYTVTASGKSELPITVNWDAAAATTLPANTNAATPGTDFPYPASRTVTIPANTLSQTFTITPTPDGLNELNEDFTVSINAPVNATLGATTTVTSEITNNPSETAPTVAITPTTVTEGDSGTSTKTFTATLSHASGRAVSVNWATVSGTATGGLDYKTANGTLTFPAGTTTQTFTVDVIGDTTDEGAGETFTITTVALPTDTTPSIVTSGPATITITDDDAAPTYTIGSLSVKEGDAATPLLLPVKLSNASNTAITFTVAVPGSHTPSASADNSTSITPGLDDYQVLNTSVVIPAGLTTGYVAVLDNGDTVFEADETAYIDITTASAFVTAPTIVPVEATLTLTNDDKAPNLEINSITGNEGDTVHVTGKVTGVAQGAMWVSTSFAGATVSGSKAADASDFTNPGSTVVNIPGGTLDGSNIPVTDVVLTDDTVNEPAETILVTGMGLANPVSGTPAAATVTSGVITIAASDGGTTGPTTPPTGPTDPSGSLTLAADKTIVQGAGSVNLHGNTTAGASVQLWAKPVGNATLVKFGDPVTADSDGDYSFNAPLTKNGIIFATTVGDMTSDTVTVWLQELPTVAGGSTAKGKISLTVTTGNPAISGSTVTIQQANADGSWSTVASGTTNSAGKWTKTWTGLKSGSSMTFRAWAAGKGPIGLLSGNSATKVVKVM